MIKTKVTVEGLDDLKKYIELVNKIASTNHIELANFLCRKTQRALKKVMDQRLSPVTSGAEKNTNLDYIEEYKKNNIPNIYADGSGFEITNSTTSYDFEYPFSIALAFEYGVGIVGENNPVQGAWDYNVNDYMFGWTFEDKNGNAVSTYGYQGMEIYRYTKIEIEKNISKWLKEYYGKLKV